MVDSLHRTRLTSVGRHVAALAVVLIALLPLMGPRSAMTSDEGAYALQVKALEAGSWRYDYRAADLDPASDHVPISNINGRGRDFFPYIQHPAYPRLVQAAVAVLGETVGLHLWSLLGTIGVALAAWLLAGEVDPRLRPAAFWLAAAGPALANGYALWAHTLSAAVAGLALVGAIRIARHGANGARLLATGAGLAAGVLLRSEGVLFAAVVVLVLAVTTRRPRLLLLGVAPAAALLAERAWIRHIAGGAYDNLRARGASSSYFHGRIAAVWHDLFQAPGLGVVALFILVGFGVKALRRWDRSSPQAIAIACAVAGALAVTQFIRQPSDLVSGLFAACPVLLLGLVFAPPVRLLTATAALFAVAVVATEYPGGGGAEWGGRFFFPLLAPLAVLAVHGLDRRLRASGELVTVEPAAARPTVTSSLMAPAALAALVAVGAMTSLLTTAHVRHEHAADMAAVLRHPAEVVVTTVPALPNVAWSVDGDVTWMAATHKALPGLLETLRAKGIGTVTVVTDDWTGRDALAAYPDVQQSREPALARLGLTLFSLRQ